MKGLTEDNYLASAMRDILVDMAVNDELPMDITQLDMDEVLRKARLKLQDSPEYKRLEAVESLGHYISSDDVDGALRLLENEENGNELADNIVTMW